MKKKTVMLGVGAGLVGAAALFLSGSFEQPSDSASIGSSSNGSLRGGVSMPTSGPGFRTNSYLGSLLGRQYAHSKLRDTLLASFEALHGQVSERTFVLGDTGRKRGGRLLPHRDHQNGLSVDIFMPVRKGNQWVAMPTAPWNALGYGLKFDAAGRSGDLSIDFESVAALLAELDQQGTERGLELALIKLAPEYVDTILRATRADRVARLRGLFVPESTAVRHTQHLHVEFRLKEGRAD